LVMRNVHKILFRKYGGKRPSGRPSCRWEDNIKMYLKEIGHRDVDMIQRAQGRVQLWNLMSAVMNL
jgi:hypothetical protein